MSDTAPTFAGWYPDPNTGGTRYWDGSRWTGDARPPRKSFAAAANHRDEGRGILGFGAMFLFASLFARQLNDGSVSTFGLFLVFFALGATGIAAGVYMTRGQGPTTEAIEKRLADEVKAAKTKRRTANIAGAAAALGRFGRQQASTPPTGNEAAVAAQLNAITDPLTAKALQNLQNLLYTRTITNEEYAAAKDKLFGTAALADQFGQIEKLAELHKAGILGDVEFAAAKARVLGL